jgi:RNA polymerase sigma-70 factor (ECF subfamily)
MQQAQPTHVIADTPDEGTTNDQNLMVRIAAGDESALGAFYDRYARLILSITLRITGDRAVAEEVLQDVIYGVWRSAQTFRHGESVVTWLMAITRHRAIDVTRSRWHRSQRHEDTLADADDARLASPLNHVDTLLLRMELHAALAEIRPDQRAVLELIYYSGLTQAEVASRLGCPVGTVKTRVRLGLHKLFQHLTMTW